MSRTDRIKEELGWLKVVLALLVAIDASLIAWLVRDYDTISIVLAVLGFIALVFTTLGIAWVSRAALRRFEALEDE